MAWYFQTSPHDMHDYDSAQTPVLVDGMFNGKMRKLVLDGGAQRLLLHAGSSNWRAPRDQQVRNVHELGEGPEQVRRAAARSRKGRHRRRLAGFAEVGRHDQLGAARLFAGDRPASTSPEGNGYSIFYLTDVDPRGSMGLGGKEEVGVGSAGSFLTAIDYKTGKVAWRHPYLRRTAAAADC